MDPPSDPLPKPPRSDGAASDVGEVSGKSEPDDSASLSSTSSSARWTPPPPEHVAGLLPQYEIEGMLGRGAVGAVYKGRQPGLDRAVCIKLLPVEAATDEAFVARFLREARILAGVHHVGIASVYDCGRTSEGHLFVVSELVDGTDLERLIYGRGLSVEQTVGIIVQVCDALQHAHSQGVVHRHIKPANVIVMPDGKVKLVDFDIASPLLDDASHITHQNVMLDAPDYIAPEHLSGQADHRADLYSIGVMMYEMLTRLIPRGRFDPPSRLVADLDPRFDALVDRAMQPEPSARYSSALEIRSDIERIMQTPASSVDGADDGGLVAATERPATVSISLSSILGPQGGAEVVRDVASEATTTSLVPPVSELRTEPATASFTAPAIAAPKEEDWNAVHGKHRWGAWKMGVAAGVLLMGIVGGGFAWYVSMQEPEVTISTRKIELEVGDEAPAVSIVVKRGELKLEQANDSMPDGLLIEAQGEQDGGKKYRLTGKATADARSERIRLVAVRGSTNSASRTLEIVVNGTTLEWQPSQVMKLTSGQAVAEGTKLVSGVATSRADWNPACPGVEVARSDDEGGTLELVGTPTEAGKFEISVTATARFGDPDTRVFHLVVEKDKEMMLASIDSPPATAPAALVGDIPKEPAVASALKMETPQSAPATPTPLVAAAPPTAMTPPKLENATPLTSPQTSSDSPTQTIPKAPGVASSIPGKYTLVKSPYNDRELSVTRDDWNSGAVLDPYAGKTVLMPKLEDPKRLVIEPDAFKHTARNPYSGEVENWEQDWKGGAKRTWAKGLSYHLPDPLPTFAMKPASYRGNRVLVSPYDGTTVTLSWDALAKGGKTQDSSGRPMYIPSISPEKMTATVIDGMKRSYVNPYTQLPETWVNSWGEFREGARGNWKSFKFVLGPMKSVVRPAIASPGIPPQNTASAPKPDKSQRQKSPYSGINLAHREGST